MIEYRKNQLNRAGQQCYGNILAAIRRQSEEFDPGNADTKDISEAYFAVYYDHPELFYMSDSSRVMTRVERTVGLFSQSRTSYILQTKNIYTAAEIAACRATIGKIVNDVCGQSFANEIEAILYCVEQVVLLTDYEINNRTNQNAAAALCYHKAQCSGIARAVKLLLDRLGIYCIIADGDASDGRNGSGPHAWNIVRANGKYYHVDATFMLAQNPKKQRPFYQDYMFYDDALLSETHQWERNKFPVCDDGSVHPTLHSIRNHNQMVSAEATQMECSKVCNTLLELRMAINEMIAAREELLCCRVNIKVKDGNDMMRAVSNACQMVMSSSSVQVSFQICIENVQNVMLQAAYE